MNAMHPGSVQDAMKARYDSLQELVDCANARITDFARSDADEHINQIHDAIDFRTTLQLEQGALLRAYETYTGATWTDVQRFFGLTKKDES